MLICFNILLEYKLMASYIIQLFIYIAQYQPDKIHSYLMHCTIT